MMGAGADGDSARGRNLHGGWTYRSLSMAAYGFGVGVYAEQYLR